MHNKLNSPTSYHVTPPQNGTQAFAGQDIVKKLTFHEGIHRGLLLHWQVGQIHSDYCQIWVCIDKLAFYFEKPELQWAG